MHMPVEGLLSASQPSSEGGDILIDSTLSTPEQRVTLLYELKHVIDDGKAAGHEAGCIDFALDVLIPSPWLRVDWLAGRRDVRALAKRYQVPITTMQYRLHMLGLLKLNRRPYVHTLRRREINHKKAA